MIIYKVTNKINGKVYIGQTTKSLDSRRKRHEWEYKNYCFPNALRKYGKENFIWEVLEHCDSKEELDEMEFHYIKQYNTLSPLGYNLTLGGEGVVGNKCSEESRRKMSIAHTGIKMPPFSEEHKRKISESHIGNKNPNFGKKMPEHNKIILIAINKGKIISEETRKRMSAATKNRYANKKKMGA
jgi:group I intron endonuclease